MGKKGKPKSEHVLGLYGVTKAALFASRVTIRLLVQVLAILCFAQLYALCHD